MTPRSANGSCSCWPDVLYQAGPLQKQEGREGREPGKLLDRDSSPLELFLLATSVRAYATSTTHGVFSACRPARERGREISVERFLFCAPRPYSILFAEMPRRREKASARKPRARRGSLHWLGPAGEWLVCFCVCLRVWSMNRNRAGTRLPTSLWIKMNPTCTRYRLPST